MGKKVVCHSAVLSCTLGTSTSELQVPDCHGISTQGKNQANIVDNAGDYNIPSFTKCRRSIPPVPCNPAVVVKWLNGQPDCTVGYELALLEDCIVPCCFGGVISIVECGQDYE